MAAAHIVVKSHSRRAPVARWNLGGSATSLSISDRAYLSALIGSSRVVAFGEFSHLAAEPLAFRNELFRYLVEELDFTAIGIESGLVEASIVQSLIAGGHADIETALADGFTWTFGSLPQNRQLIEWMAAYNQSAPAGSRLSFFGFDISGSPGNVSCANWYERPLAAAIDFLDRITPEQASDFRRRLQGQLFDKYVTTPGSRLERLLFRDAAATSVTIRELADSIGSLATTCEENDANLAARHAIVAVQLDDWLRLMPPAALRAAPKSMRNKEELETMVARSWSASEAKGILASCNLRDRAQADNILWYLDHRHRGEKVLLFAAAPHLSASPVFMDNGGHRGCYDVCGTHLRAALGGNILILGSTAGGGEIGFPGAPIALQTPASDTLDGRVAALEAHSHIVDLRALPTEQARAFDEELIFAHTPTLSSNSIAGFDALVHFERSTSAFGAAS